MNFNPKAWFARITGSAQADQCAMTSSPLTLIEPPAVSSIADNEMSPLLQAFDSGVKIQNDAATLAEQVINETPFYKQQKLLLFKPLIDFCNALSSISDEEMNFAAQCSGSDYGGSDDFTINIFYGNDLDDVRGDHWFVSDRKRALHLTLNIDEEDSYGVPISVPYLLQGTEDGGYVPTGNAKFDSYKNAYTGAVAEWYKFTADDLTLISEELVLSLGLMAPQFSKQITPLVKTLEEELSAAHNKFCALTPANEHKNYTHIDASLNLA